MKLTDKEQLEVNEFSTKYPTIVKIFAFLEKRIDDLEKQLEDTEGTYSCSG